MRDILAPGGGLAQASRGCVASGSCFNLFCTAGRPPGRGGSSELDVMSHVLLLSAEVLDQERKVCSSSSQSILNTLSFNQRALEAEQRLREREKLLAEKDRPKVMFEQDKRQR